MRLLGVALLLAACGGTGATATPSSPTASAPTLAAESPTRAPGPIFAEIVRAGASSSYKIKYVYRVTQNEQTQTVELTTYVRPPDMRWDFASPLGGASSFFYLKDGIFICSSGAQPTPSCVKIASAAEMQQTASAQIQQLARDHPERFTSTVVAARVIAGVSAQCFEVNDVSAEYGQGTLCYSEQGLPLYSHFSSASGEFTMEASDVSTTVTDADLKLPGPVQTLP